MGQHFTESFKRRLAASLVKARLAAGLSQGEVAAKMGWKDGGIRISQWECGDRVPQIDKLIRLADCYGCTLDALVGRRRRVKG